MTLCRPSLINNNVLLLRKALVSGNNKRPWNGSIVPTNKNVKQRHIQAVMVLCAQQSTALECQVLKSHQNCMKMKKKKSLAKESDEKPEKF